MTTSIHQACLEGNIRMVENLINNDSHALKAKDEVSSVKMRFLKSKIMLIIYYCFYRTNEVKYLQLMIHVPFSLLNPLFSSIALGLLWKQTSDCRLFM